MQRSGVQSGNGLVTLTLILPTISGTRGGQTTTNEAPVKPFSGVTITDPYAGATDTLTISYTGGGALTGSALLTGSAGSYTLAGTAAAITSALDALSFTPVDGVPNTSVTTNFTLSDVSSALSIPVADTTTTVTDTDPAVRPTVTGGVANQSTTNEAPALVFTGVTVTDANANATDTLTITYTGPGTLTGSALLTGTPGSYTLTGTAAAITSAVDALSFTPVDGVPGTSVTTKFTLQDTSSALPGNAVSDITPSITDTDPALAPTITGTLAGQTTTSEKPIQPFAGVTIADSNTGATDTLSITYTGPGTLSGSSLLTGSAGSYTLTGTAAAVTSALDALFFTPVDGVPNTSVTTNFTLSDVSSALSIPVVDTATTVTDIDPAVAPTITGTVGSQTTTNEAPTAVFSGVTVADSNAGATDTLAITYTGPGTLSGSSALTGSAGSYSLTGTAAAITTALDALSFTPVDGVPNTSVTTTFTLTDTSSALPGTPAVNSTASLTDTDPAVPPTITGTVANQTTTNQAAETVFATVTVSDANANATDTLAISYTGPGTLAGSALLTGNAGSYTLTGSAAAITAALDALLFTPVDAVPNTAVTTNFTLTDTSTALPGTPAVSTTASITDTDPPAPSTITGAVANQAITDETTGFMPFASVTVADPNGGTQSDSAVITLSNTAGGTLSGTGLTTTEAGVYTLTATTPAALTSELEALVFTPTAHQVAPTQTVTTGLTLAVTNAAGLQTTNATTSVVAKAVNDPPTISGTVAGQTTVDYVPIDPFAKTTITDPDLEVSDSLVITVLSGAGSATDANGTLSGAGLSKTGTGTYTLAAASPAALTSELQALVFTPTKAEVAAGKTVTTDFTLTASQTAGGTTVTTTNSTTSVVVTALNYINGPANGFAVIEGTPGQDVITAHGYANAIFANGGNDIISAGSGLASVNTSSGNTTVALGGSLNLVTGGNGNNTITGAPGGYTGVTLGNGNNTVEIGGTGDVILLGNGNNMVSGTQGMAFITTGSGNDTIVLGGSGNTVNAGGGTNTISGGTGHDTFVLPAAGQGFDSISGFTETNGDVLNLQAALAATKWNGQASTLGNYLKVTDSGGSTTLAIAPTGSGTATTIATLVGAGNLGLSDLLSHHSLVT